MGNKMVDNLGLATLFFSSFEIIKKKNERFIGILFFRVSSNKIVQVILQDKYYFKIIYAKK